MRHVDASEKGDGEDDVHRGAGDGDDETLPAWVGEKFSRVAGAVVHGIFARHFDVAAEGQGVDAVVGFTFAEADEALAEADGKLLHAYAEIFGRDEMTQLVQKDHDAEDDRHDVNGVQKRQKLGHIYQITPLGNS